MGWVLITLYLLPLFGVNFVKALIVLGAGALLVSPGLLVLWLTRSKAPQD